MVQQRKRTDSYQLESPNIGANCPQTLGTVPKLAALSPSPQRGTDLSPKARARVLTEHIVVSWFTGEAELATVHVN